MSYLANQHYLIKTKDLISYLFYINKDNNIHYKLFNSKSVLLKDEVLNSDEIIDFSVTIDNNDKIHLMYIDVKGQLKYYVGKNNDWDSKDITSLDITSNNYRYLSLYITNELTHLIFIKTNLLNTMVSSIEHLYWDKSTVNKITATSYMTGRYASPLHISFDSLDNIHVLYKGIYKKNHQLYYIRFNAKSKKWGSNEILTDLEGDHSHPYMLIDKYNNLHLCWCSVEVNNFVLKYKRKTNILNIKAKWSEALRLSDQNCNIISPVIIQDGNKIKIFGRQNGVISLISTNDYGLSWTPISEDYSYKAEELLLLKYFSNDSTERDNFELSYIYGEIKDYIRTPGLDIYIKDNQIDTTSKSIPKPKEQILPIKVIDEVKTAKHSTKDQDSLQDERIISILKDIEGYIENMESQIKKLEELKVYLHSSKAIQASNKKEEDKKQIEIVIKLIKDIESQLYALEEEKHQLIIELNYYNKKIEYFENKLIDFKKQYLTLEELINKDITTSTSLLDRIINYFK